MIGALILLLCIAACGVSALAADAAVRWAIVRWRKHSLARAIREVSMGRAARISAPGKWRVWREGETVQWEVIG